LLAAVFFGEIEVCRCHKLVLATVCAIVVVVVECCGAYAPISTHKGLVGDK
jgi:hypothetical protein